MHLAGLCRLGRDAEIRYLPDGTAIASLALAFNYGKKDGQGNRPTQWIDASLFGEQAKKLQQYLVKGQQLDVILGEPHIEQFTRRDNTVGHSLRARVMNLEFAGKAPERAAGAPNTAAGAPSTPASAPSAPQGASKPPAPPTGGDFGDFDDIPF